MKVLTWLVSALLGLVVIALGFIYFLPGWDLYVVKSDSMTPTFAARDLIVTRPVEQVRVGDVVTFKRGNEVVTHRVVSIEGESLIMKGDANDTVDPQPVAFSHVDGGYLVKVPYAGYVTEFISTKRGWFLAIVLPAIILVLLLVREIIREALRDDESSAQGAPPSR